MDRHEVFAAGVVEGSDVDADLRDVAVDRRDAAAADRAEAALRLTGEGLVPSWLAALAGPGDRLESYPPHHGGAAELLAMFTFTGVGEDCRALGGEADATAEAAAGAFLGWFGSLGVGGGGGVAE